MNADALSVERTHSVLIPELYFLIAKFLNNGPFRAVAELMLEKLDKAHILPKRTDWLGNEHPLTYVELERKYSHIGPDHLLQICSRIVPILDEQIPPSVPGVLSLLGAGRQSLLRTRNQPKNIPKLRDFITRKRGQPIADGHALANGFNVLYALHGRESSGAVSGKVLFPTPFYSRMQVLRRTLGHLSAIYCVAFDRTGQYVLTGADDLLVKLWSARDGRLLNTFRGATAEISDLDINIENTLLAAGSLDRILRIWNLQTGAQLAVLQAHTNTITSVNFCPATKCDLRYLATTSADNSVAFWTYTHGKNGVHFISEPTVYNERLRPGGARILCSAFSTGGMFMAAGSADHHVRVYKMHGDEGPHRILEVEAHTDIVDSIVWAHKGLRFISGSKDGTAHVWHFETQQWKSYQLFMSAKLPGSKTDDDDVPKKLRVIMVCWDCDDRFVVTSASDHLIKIWESQTGKLEKVLAGHTDDVYCLDPHPSDANILLTAAYDGQLIIWDINLGQKLAQFQNTIDGQGFGAINDAKWSPDGMSIAATDSHGHLILYGFGTGHKLFKILPNDLFFHTDYRPLQHNAQHWVIDEQTQVPPHLMPPPFLVDLEGNPYPPYMQKLVPGREQCSSEQLIPNIVFNGERPEVYDPNIQEPNNRSQLDIMIEFLGQRLDNNRADSNEPTRRDAANDAASVSSRQNDRHPNGSTNGSVNGRAVGPLRRDIEGVRQSSGNWQRDENIKWARRTLVEPLTVTELAVAKRIIEANGEFEIDVYRREMRRRPVMISTATAKDMAKTARGRRGVRRTKQPAYRTRAVISEQIEQEPPDDVPSSDFDRSSDETEDEEDLLRDAASDSDSDSSESSGYSDWVTEHGVTLQPPKRARHKPVAKRTVTTDDDEPSTSKRTVRQQKKVAQIPRQLTEVPEAYKPSEWLSEVVPRKAPYYPQMGDELVYFRQGHELYIEAVRDKNVYSFGPKDDLPRLDVLKTEELVKVVGIKYQIRPPRLCCLKLAQMDETRHLTGTTFEVKYHDMPDVIDFFVLKQMYDVAMARDWKPHDRFRCMIENNWWIGTIVAQSAYNSDFPGSKFMCFRVKWDSGEYDSLSPWDLEPINDERQPENPGGALAILAEEIQTILYKPLPDEWPDGDRDGTCARIINGLEQVMSLAIAEHFCAPVDLSVYSAYAFVVEYPIDLSTIKRRFENRFYRRITSAQFDVRYLATNAERFNEPHSRIVKNARIVTDLCLRVIETNDLDVAGVYHQLMDAYHSSESESETKKPKRKTRANRIESSDDDDETDRASRRLRVRRYDKPSDWKIEALSVLDEFVNDGDSVPFRQPVDIIEHPDYHHVIDTPMDLNSVREDLTGGNYDTPDDFIKDMKLIFSNSKAYNTNKRSRIYSMTVRLQYKFEGRARILLRNWKAARRRQNTTSTKNRPRTTRNTTRTDPNQPCTSRQALSTDRVPRLDDNNTDSDDEALANVRGRPNKTASRQSSVSTPKPTDKYHRDSSNFTTSDDDDDEAMRTDESSDEPLSSYRRKPKRRTARRRRRKREDAGESDEYRPRKQRRSQRKRRRNRYNMSDDFVVDSDDANVAEGPRRTRARRAKVTSDSEFEMPVGRGKRNKSDNEAPESVTPTKKRKRRRIITSELSSGSEYSPRKDNARGRRTKRTRVNGTNALAHSSGEEDVEVEVDEENEEPTVDPFASINGNGDPLDSDDEVLSSYRPELWNDITSQLKPTAKDPHAPSTSNHATYAFANDHDYGRVDNDSPGHSLRARHVPKDRLRNQPRRSDRKHYGENSSNEENECETSRRRIKRSVNGACENGNDANGSASDTTPLSGLNISSRGRVRKLTARARALLDD